MRGAALQKAPRFLTWAWVAALVVVWGWAAFTVFGPVDPDPIDPAMRTVGSATVVASIGLTLALTAVWFAALCVVGLIRKLRG